MHRLTRRLLMKTHRLLLHLAVVLTLFLPHSIPANAWAGPPTDQLRAGVDRVLKALNDPEMKRDGRLLRAEIRKVAEDFFDVRETAMRTLGRHWQARTPAERDEFVKLFGDVLERAYLAKIEMYGGEKITFLGDTIDGTQATVRTKIVSKQGTEIPVDYRMLRRGDRWLAYDVHIEGISLVANYRSQFNRVIMVSSYEELTKALKTKTEAEANARGANTSQR
jgi:phospholipid transport system substrate-binding protein